MLEYGTRNVAAVLVRSFQPTTCFQDLSPSPLPDTLVKLANGEGTKFTEELGPWSCSSYTPDLPVKILVNSYVWTGLGQFKALAELSMSSTKQRCDHCICTHVSLKLPDKDTCYNEDFTLQDSVAIKNLRKVSVSSAGTHSPRFSLNHWCPSTTYLLAYTCSFTCSTDLICVKNSAVYSNFRTAL